MSNTNPTTPTIRHLWILAALVVTALVVVLSASAINHKQDVTDRKTKRASEAIYESTGLKAAVEKRALGG